MVFNYIRLRLNDKMECVEFFLDLKKAFDTVNHQILLKMLENVQIRGVALDWFESYLSNRRQAVKICNEISDQREIKCSDPDSREVRCVVA